MHVGHVDKTRSRMGRLVVLVHGYLLFGVLFAMLVDEDAAFKLLLNNIVLL
jgi:hypothetical protein